MTRNRKDIIDESKQVRNKLRAFQSIGSIGSPDKMDDTGATPAVVAPSSVGHVPEGESKAANSIFDRIIKVIVKPPEGREAADDFRLLVSWLKQKVLTFRTLSAEVVGVILKECTFTTANNDDVIIRQGDLGDRCYVLLRGSVTVYINAVLSDEEDTEKLAAMASRTLLTNEHGVLDRTKFGACIDVMEVGRSFGEVALLSSTCIRQATIIANERCDLLVVNRDLYNRSLHYSQAADFSARVRFVENHPLFQRWPQHHRKQMAMSIQRKKVEFDQPIVRQGDVVQALYFVNSGQGKVTVDPLQHLAQYPHLRHLLLSHGNSGANDSGDSSQMTDNSTIISPRWNAWHSNGIENAPQSTRSLVDHGHVTNEVEFTARLLEGRRRRPARRVTGRCKHLVEVSLVGANDIIGDIEFALGLRTHIQSVICTEQCDVFFLNARNYERLVIKKHPTTAEMIIGCVQLKLSARISRLHFDEVPLFRRLLDKISAVSNEGGMSDGHSRLHGLRDGNELTDRRTGHVKTSIPLSKNAAIEMASSRRQLQQQEPGLTDRRNQPQQSTSILRSTSFRQSVATAPSAFGLTGRSGVTVLCSSMNSTMNEWKTRPSNVVTESGRLPTLVNHGRSQTDLAVGISHRHHPYQSVRDLDVERPVESINDHTDIPHDGDGSFFRTNIAFVTDDGHVQADEIPSDLDRIMNGRVVAVAPAVYASCSDEVLARLEKRIRTWHDKVNASPACVQSQVTHSQTKAVVPQLKRISLQGREPLHGNQVLLRRKRQQQSTPSSANSRHSPSNAPGDQKKCAKEIVRMLLDGKKFATCTDLFDETLYL